MEFILDDGGRTLAGFTGVVGDCVARSIAIASGRPYTEVYEALSNGQGSQRKTKWQLKKRSRSARNGISVRRKWFKDYMASIGFVWTPTMAIGSGCKTHLAAGELPNGRLVVAVSKHYTAVIDGTIRDLYNPERDGRRCVYGYWSLIGV